MTTNQTMTVDLTKLNGSSHGPALQPNKRKAKPAEAVAYKPKDVVAAKVAKAEAKRNAALKGATGPSLKAVAKAEEALAEIEQAKVEVVEPAPEVVATVELPPVTSDEMLAALAVIARATKQQAEAIRKAAAERKKVAPEGEKVSKAKALTPEQEAKAKRLAEDLKRLGNVIGLIGSGRAGDMALAVAGIKTPDVKLVIKHHNPKFKLSGVKVAELRAELIGYSDVKHAKTEA